MIATENGQAGGEEMLKREPFFVRISSQGDLSRVRVDGIENTNWLLLQLSEGYVFRTFDPLIRVAGSTECIFSIPLNPPLSHYSLSRMLASFPFVMLVQDGIVKTA